jgi:hypothetical protein
MSLPEIEQRIRAEFRSIPRSEPCFAALHFVQKEWRLGAQGSGTAAGRAPEISVIDVWEVISFYSMLPSPSVLPSPGLHQPPLLCPRRTAVVRACERVLDIRPERGPRTGCSRSVRWSVSARGTAPALQVNNRRYEEALSPGDIDGLVARLRDEDSTSGRESS